MTWILIVMTSVTVIVSPHPNLDACRSQFKENVESGLPIYPGEIEHVWCIAASGNDVQWKKAHPDYPM